MSRKYRREKRRSGLFSRYRNLSKDLHSPRASRRSRAKRLIAMTVCVPILIASITYIGWFYARRHAIEKENAYVATLYVSTAPTIMPVVTDPPASVPTSEPTKEPTTVPTKDPTAIPTEAPTPEPTEAPTQEPTEEPTEAPSAEPFEAVEMPGNIAVLITESPEQTAYAIPTRIPRTESPTATATVTPEPTDSPEPTESAQPSVTPSATVPDPVIYALPSPPPVQNSFKELLNANPETVGYLTVGSQISLPVVQRVDDNDYYLTHSFLNQESEAGTLFLDGSNRLNPEDPVLLIYGHNMRNGTMFQQLTNFERLEYLRSQPVIHFNSIYKDGNYTPVAVFSASMEPDSKNYLNIRQFTFDETSWELYILKLEKLSMYDMEIDAKYGEQLLILVTCEYRHNNGRLVVVLRKLRPGETEESLRETLMNVHEK